MREAAQRQLIAQGNVLELRQSLDHPDPEVVMRLSHIIYYLTAVKIDVAKLPQIWNVPADERYDYEWNEEYQTYDNDLATQFYEEAFRAKRVMADYTSSGTTYGYIFGIDPTLYIFYYDQDLGRSAMYNLLSYKRWQGRSNKEIEIIVERTRECEKTGEHVAYRSVNEKFHRPLPPSVVLEKECVEQVFWNTKLNFTMAPDELE